MRHVLSWRMVLVISGLVLFFSIFLVYSQPGRVYSQATSLTAAQDGFVDPNNPAASYNGKRLEVTYSNFPAFVPTRHSLLQWNLAGGAASLSNASLLLQLVENNLPAGASVNLGLYALPDGWNETTVTASNEPAIGNLLQTVTINAGFTGQVRFNASAVGAYLETQRTGDGLASFLLRLDGGSGSLGFGGHIFFEDREGTADGVNGNEPFIEIPAPPPPTNANITINLDAQPNTKLKFLFSGSLGAFQLIDATTGDSRATKTFTVAPGVYTVAEQVPSGYYLSIACNPSASGVVGTAANSVAITIAGGQNVACTFTNQKSAIIRALKYNDLNGNHKRNNGEPYLPGWTINLYNAQGALLGTQVTNSQGKVSFTGVRPGSLTVCEAQKSGWFNSQPGNTNPTYGQPCYTQNIAPGATVEFRFGNATTQPAAAATESDAVSGVRLIEPVDTITDENTYPDPVNDDAFLNTPEPDTTNDIYLPLINQ